MTDSAQIRRALVQKLESLYRSGVHCMPRPEAALAAAPVTPTPVSATPSGNAKPAATTLQANGPPQATPDVQPAESSPIRIPPYSGVELPSGEKSPALTLLAQEVAKCTCCEQLASSRTQTVFGVGNPNARLVFFGEAPGADEDRQGEPFVGKAGQLLTKIIEACTLTRDDVYIMNVLKCRPPANRNPTPEEATSCRPFFEKQLEIIRPEFICCLGSIAATTLLETTAPVGMLRGQFHDWRGISVAVTYHPAYLLRHAPAKKLVWTDMKMLMTAMGIEL